MKDARRATKRIGIQVEHNGNTKEYKEIPRKTRKYEGALSNTTACKGTQRIAKKQQGMREDIQEYKGKLRIQWNNKECDKEIWVAPAGARAVVNRMV